MRGFIAGLVLGLIAGVILAVAGPSGTKTGANTPPAATQTNVNTPALKWRLASVFAGTETHSATAAQLLAKRVTSSSGNKLEISFHGAGSLVPALEVFDAVASGTIEAAFSSPAYWGHKSSELELFGGIPFGPEILEYLAWYDAGGGREILQEAYRRHNIHGQICGVSGPVSGGWFAAPLDTVAGLKEKSIAAVGLGAKVLARAGAKPVAMAAHDSFMALKSGKIAGATFATPNMDSSQNMPTVARQFYFPGWAQQFSTLDLLVNLNQWERLPTNIKQIIETTCSAAIAETLARSEGGRFELLKNLVKAGVDVKRWPAGMTDELKLLWNKEVNRLIANDRGFAKAWRSLARFRVDYAIWKELGYL